MSEVKRYYAAGADLYDESGIAGSPERIVVLAADYDALKARHEQLVEAVREIVRIIPETMHADAEELIAALSALDGGE